MLIDAVLVGVDDPVDLGAVFQIGNGFVVGELFHLGVVVVELSLELLVPYIDIENLAAVSGFCLRAAGRIPAASAAAAAQKAQNRQGRKRNTHNSSLHDRFLLFPI